MSQETTTTTTIISEEDAIKAYVKDPEVRDNHIKIANKLKDIFRNNWFTMDMIQSKTTMKDMKHISEMMMGLQLFNLVVAKEGGKNFKYKTKFRLVINPQDRLKVLQEYKKQTEEQLGLIEKEIQQVQQQIEEEENSSKLSN